MALPALVVVYVRPMDLVAIKAVVDRVLAEGPRPIEELADAVVTDGLTASTDRALDYVDELFERDSDYWTLGIDTPAERKVLTKWAVDRGLTLTHVLTEDEQRDGKIEVNPDLTVLLADVSGGIELAYGSGDLYEDGSEPGRPRVAGPPEWLFGFDVGDVLSFRREDGRIEVTWLEQDELADPGDEVAALRAAFDVWARPDGSFDAVPVMMEALGSSPTAFRRPVAPLGAIFAGLDLETRDGEWGPAATPWESFRERRGEWGDAGDGDDGDDGPVEVGDRFGFDRCCDVAFDRVVAAFERFASGDRDVDGNDLFSALGHGDVPAAVAFEHRGEADVLLAFAESLAATSTGRRRAPALALEGHVLLGTCDPLGAYERFRDAVAADDGY